MSPTWTSLGTLTVWLARPLLLVLAAATYCTAAAAVFTDFVFVALAPWLVRTVSVTSRAAPVP